jgi:carbamoyl-phosphate synthase small subunit
MDDIARYFVKDAVKAVAPISVQYYGAEDGEYTVALWNFGARKNTVNEFVKRGCRVISVPAQTTAEEILALGAQGVVISDGPGDPLEAKFAVQEIQKIVGKIPVFGIGLGHQLLAMAFGADTYKQKYGHRGSNQPVKSLKENKVYISTQNHGYAVDADTIKVGEVSFVSVNDGTCEGIDYAEYKAFSVQFDPATCVIGNLDNPLYTKFFALMRKENDNA